MVVVFPNAKLTLSPNAFTEMPLFVGKELTLEQYRSLVHFTKNEALLNYAISLASKGSYSVHEAKRETEAIERTKTLIFFNLLSAIIASSSFIPKSVLGGIGIVNSSVFA